MKEQNWAVSVRYAAPGGRPFNRRHPSPDDFCRRTVVGPAGPATVEAVLDLLDVPEETRARLRANSVVRNFVDGKLVPDQPYSHRADVMYYVSPAVDAQLVECSIEFVSVSQITGTGDPA